MRFRDALRSFKRPPAGDGARRRGRMSAEAFRHAAAFMRRTGRGPET